MRPELHRNKNLQKMIFIKEKLLELQTDKIAIGCCVTCDLRTESQCPICRQFYCSIHYGQNTVCNNCYS